MQHQELIMPRPRPRVRRGCCLRSNSSRAAASHPVARRRDTACRPAARHGDAACHQSARRGAPLAVQRLAAETPPATNSGRAAACDQDLGDAACNQELTRSYLIDACRRRTPVCFCVYTYATAFDLLYSCTKDLGFSRAALRLSVAAITDVHRSSLGHSSSPSGAGILLAF